MTILQKEQQRLDEPLLEDNISKYIQVVKYPKLNEMYEKAESMFWTKKEIDFSADLKDWNSLNSDEQTFIEYMLAFFAASDGIVLENLITNFCVEVKVPECRNFYAFQAMIENIHAQVYASLIDTYIKDNDRKDFLFNAIETIPTIKKKADWALKWFNTDRPFEERVIAFVVVEGVFFSASFCSIFWLKSRNKMTKALGKSNELISRDESLHSDFGILLYEHLLNKVSEERVYQIFSEAVDIEIDFICKSIPCRLIGMNSDLMAEYIKYVADRLLVQLGFNKLYNTENPFDFMKSFSLDGKTNFFEERVTEYVHSSVAKPTENSWSFGDSDFL